MRIFIALSAVLVISGVQAQLDLGVADSTMRTDMEDYAFGEALIYYAEDKDFGHLANNLRKAMTDKFRGNWLTLLGTNLTVNGIKFADNTTLMIKHNINNQNLLIAQQEKTDKVLLLLLLEIELNILAC